MTFTRRLGAALATTALAAGLAGVGAGAASAAPLAATAPAAATTQLLGDSYGYLTIRSLGSGNYSVTITGHANLTQALPNNIFFRLYGDDTWSDDVLYRTPSYSTD